MVCIMSRRTITSGDTFKAHQWDDGKEPQGGFEQNRNKKRTKMHAIIGCGYELCVYRYI